VQGLRAIAVGVVVLYHAGATWLPGGYVGVDVFFVISGFLITGGLVQELARTGTISFAEFYARRARRILPAAFIAIVVTCAASWFLLPPLRRERLGWDAFGAGAYFENWRLAGISTDYLQSNQAASPFQHFWSLAVEEQFYLVWPLLLVAGASYLRKGGVGSAPIRSRWFRPALFLTVSVVGVPSFLLSIALTARDPAGAYFVTHTRVWELAIGALLAIALPRGRIPSTGGAILAWLGLVGILTAAVLYTTATPFPGYHALLPTVGAVAVIMGGGHRYGPVRLIGTRPFTWLGDLSYSYYLWHWPLIVLVTAQLGGDISFKQGSVVALVALLPSWLSLKYVERPIQFSESLRVNVQASLAMGVALSVAASVAGMLLVYSVWPPPPPRTGPILTAEVSEEEADEPRGAAVLGADPRDDALGAPSSVAGEVIPAVDAAGRDVAGCPTLRAETDVDPCTYGAPDGGTRIALVGDSHAAQWAPALNEAGKGAGWRITEYTKQNCPAAGVTSILEGGVDATCGEWTADVLQRLREAPPDVAVFSGVDRVVQLPDGGAADPATSHSLQASGLASIWRELEGLGVRVIALRDTPRPKIDIPDCISGHREDLMQCTFDRVSANGNGQSMVQAAEMAEVPLIDLNDAICPTDLCAPIIGHVIVYADDNHITATYASSLAPRLEAAMRGVGVS
jgi:peptidoglycan/LPS O-acetylase OafA/YrhL